LRKKTSSRSKKELQQLKRRLNRIKGQLTAIERMLEQNRYCIDIVNLSKAAQSALKGFENQILEDHLKECVHKAYSLKSKREVKKKIREIINLW
jgi:DNA-binding FrmR family transcriptional regulator